MPSSLGPAEILVILVVALLVLGPKRLPEAGRQIGKAISEVRRWSQSMQSEIRDVMDSEADGPGPGSSPETNSKSKPVSAQKSTEPSSSSEPSDVPEGESTL